MQLSLACNWILLENYSACFARVEDTEPAEQYYEEIYRSVHAVSEEVEYLGTVNRATRIGLYIFA